jgi:hypothetical protein
MALNPFFQHGSASEQRLIQQLINEQLRMYGIEIGYLPRKFVRTNTIIREVVSSKFNDTFMLEAYLSTYEGHTGSGDILTKFGMSLKDELTLVISKERFEDFISPFLESMPDDEITVSSRPREGDLIYFPLGRRLFEVKFVEHEKPFYQLGQSYVYELQCELFEYQDELGGYDGLDSTLDEIDESLQNEGYITALELFPSVTTAEVIGGNNNGSTGYVRRIIMNDDGSGYTSRPRVAISTAPVGGTNASAVAITTCRNGVCSIQEILLTSIGSGYTVTPTVTIIGGGGVGAAATAEIVNTANYFGFSPTSISNAGSGYVSKPTVTIEEPLGELAPIIDRRQAYAIGVVGTGSSVGIITQILISDAGIGYHSNPTVTISAPPGTSGIGTFIFNEVVTGQVSGTKARVKTWNSSNSTISLGMPSGEFVLGENIVGAVSGASYSIKVVQPQSSIDKYEQNDEIEQEADLIIDFTESNPFGTY